MSYNGNFVCVFECTIVNLAKLRIRNLQILLEIGLLKKKTEQNKTKKKEKKKRKERKRKEIKIALSLGYPNSYFYNKRCNMSL